MIKIVDDNVFDAKAECIVNTINCVGYMGKGLALEFAVRYPKLEHIYIAQCKNHQIKTGELYFYEIDSQKIINFPTKFHFKYPSKIEWIEEGLDYFVLNYKNWNIKSIAFPLLGARNGGLNPADIIKLIKMKLSNVNLDVFICLNKKPDKLSIEMGRRFNNANIYKMAEDLNINKKQFEILMSAHNKQVDSFNEIATLQFIGSVSYKKIFNYLNLKSYDESVSLI